jgi:stage V sporulation protein AC
MLRNNDINLQKDYQSTVKKVSPKPTIFKNCIMAFISGGLICDVGQFFLNYFKAHGLDILQAGTATSIVMVFLGSFLTGIGLYDLIGKYAGAGTVVPITGFANSIVAPAMEFKKEGYVFGVAARMFNVAGPVLVYGTASSIIIGLIYYFLK